MLVKKLLADFHLREQGCLIQILQGTRSFMQPRLLQVDATAGTIQCHFALLAATLRADPSVHSRTETFFFSLFADRASHKSTPEIIITR
jgi:hypothetical protein